MGIQINEQPGYTLKAGDWNDLAADASLIRFEVFVQEQQVPPEEELDEIDKLSYHAVVYNEQQVPVATGRLLPDGHIGRMAVRKIARGTGIGGIVLAHLIDTARTQGYKEVVLSAQTHAIGFYEKYGFHAEGDIYLDAGIEHRLMRLVF